jgi:DNA-binding CsgD family transcriptional regulator
VTLPTLVKLSDNRLHAPEWLRVAMALLEQRDEPCVLLDRSARVLAANTAFADLVGAPASLLVERPWAEALGARGDVTPARIARAADGVLTPDEWVVRGADDKALRLSVQIAPIRGTHAVLASVVRWCVANALMPPVGVRAYEIKTVPFGALAWSQPVDGETAVLGEPCFVVLHGRQAPCPDCPAQAPLHPGQTRVGVVISGRGEPGIVSAQAVAKDAIRLTARSVDDALFAELVEAKLVEHAVRSALTQRELEVLHLLMLGRAPADVARSLGFSVSTAKFHVQNVLRKLGAESRVDLLRVLLRVLGRPEGTELSDGPASESRRRVGEASAAVGDRPRSEGSAHGRGSPGGRGRGRKQRGSG